ncbi:MAG: hypothetical protein P8Y70_01100, partial [Candidatus Lokiarchaeota archaeon]
MTVTLAFTIVLFGATKFLSDKSNKILIIISGIILAAIGVWQFYAETFLLSLIAYGLAILLTELFLPSFNLLAGKNLSLKFADNPVLTFGSLGIVLITTLLAGSYPALLLSKFRPIK